MLAGELGRQGSSTRAQRHLGLRLIAIEMPIPEPHRDAALGLAGSDARGQLRAVFRVVDALEAVGAEVGHVMALLAQPGGKARP